MSGVPSTHRPRAAWKPRRYQLLLLLLLSATALPCEDQVAGLERRIREGGARDLVSVAARLVADCPANARARNALATLLEESGDLAGAAAQYKEARRLDPKWAYPLLGLGDLAVARRDFAGARQFFLEALRLAASPEEKSQAVRSLENLPGSGTSYGFKSAARIESALDVGRDHRGKRGAGVRIPNQALDSYISETGIAVNFSIAFDFDSASLRPEALPQLLELSSALGKARRDERYVIEGHSSSEGDPAHNTKLSLERAKTVAAYLVASGVNPTILRTAGIGASRVVRENGVENREKSRRVTVLRPFEP